MSNFMKKGFRADKKNMVKEHVNIFYKILSDMERLKEKCIAENIHLTEDNIETIIEPLYDRPLDDIEKFILLNKYNNAKDNKEGDSKIPRG